MDSVFSKIIRGEIPCYFLAEDERYFAFLDIRPLAFGHALVVPKNQVDYIFDLGEEDLSGILLFSKKVAGAIKNCVSCKRIGISVVGLEVPHAHVHLIPITNIGDMDFSKSPIETTHEQLSQLALDIRTALS